jgi:hypothetical protein
MVQPLWNCSVQDLSPFVKDQTMSCDVAQLHHYRGLPITTMTSQAAHSESDVIYVWNIRESMKFWKIHHKSRNIYFQRVPKFVTPVA